MSRPLSSYAAPALSKAGSALSKAGSFLSQWGIPLAAMAAAFCMAAFARPDRVEPADQVAFQRAAAQALPQIGQAVAASEAGKPPAEGARFAVVSKQKHRYRKVSYELLDARTGCRWTVWSHADEGSALEPEKATPPGCLAGAR